MTGVHRYRHPQKLTASRVEAIRKARACGQRSADIAADFGVSQSMICLIATGRAWAHAPGPITRVIQDRTLPPEVRFANLVDRRGPDECWPWLGACSPDGYGRFNADGETIVASRFALTLSLGRDLDASEQSCHRCDNPPCCNPDHLFPGSAADNVADMIAKDRHHHVLTRSDVLAIVTEGARMGRGRFVELAKKYGVTQQYIGRLVRRSTGAPVPAPRIKPLAIAIAIAKAAGVAAVLLLALSAAGCEQSFWPSAYECRAACAPRVMRSLIKGACICDSTQPDGGR